MTWRESLAAAAPSIAPGAAEAIAADWSGARIYLPMRAARLHWRRRHPHGAAERFAETVLAQILLRGGTRNDALAALLPLAQRHLII